MNLDVLKENLTLELENESLDFDRVLSLAGEIAKADAQYVRFSVDASHIARLGTELVSKQETAVAELIKNGYDADAESIKLTFIDSSRSGGTLIIEDDGSGMSRKQLIDGFMRISTKDKNENPLSAKFGRQRAGRKGIGRFSAQRLGSRLEVHTGLADDDYSLLLSIDWDKFETSNDLTHISSKLNVLKERRVGTKLVISGLKDPWSPAQIRRAYRYVSELIQPVDLTFRPKRTNSEDPGFEVSFFRQEGGIPETIASNEENIFGHSFAVFSGHVDLKGEPFYSVESARFKINLTDQVLMQDPKVKTVMDADFSDYRRIAGISFRAHYFIEDALPAGTRGSVRNILRNNGGIKIYRNGFRVLPYGEAKDDWLGLQRSSALRALLPPHANSNFLGFVQIIDVDGENFEETASREGLIENEAYFQLQDYIYKALMRGVVIIAQARERKVFSTDKKVEGKPKAARASTAAEMIKQIQGVAKELAGTNGYNLKAPELNNRYQDGDGEDEVSMVSNTTDHLKIDDLNEAAEELSKASVFLMKEIGMLRVLASLGLTIGEFTHETRHVLTALSASVAQLDNNIRGAQSLDPVLKNISALQSYMRYFDKAVTQNSQRSLEVLELRDVIYEFESIIESPLKRKKIEFKTDVKGYDLFLKPSHKSEWVSILFNLFTNSVKAIGRSRSKGQIFLSAGEVDDNNLYLEFSDNGDGIPDENKDYVFDAFFTTSTAADALADDESQITGSGLGLKIIKDIIEDFGGEIYVHQASLGYSTCMRIELPRARDEEVPDDLR